MIKVQMFLDNKGKPHKTEAAAIERNAVIKINAARANAADFFQSRIDAVTPLQSDWRYEYENKKGQSRVISAMLDSPQEFIDVLQNYIKETK